MKNILIVYRLIVLLVLILLQAWQVNAAYRDTNDFCKGAPCHTGTAGTTEGVPLSETDDKVHDSCIDCHDPNSGSLVGSAAGRESNEVNMCIDCHGGPARFLSHQHHENLNKVSYDDGVNDTSQPGQQGCGDCHGSGPQGGPYSLASWSDILFVHNNSCYTCHDYANEPSVGDNTPFLADVQFAIANPGSGVTCATCHKPKVPDTSHGSHGVSDFVRTANCTTACHPSPDGIGEMHVTLRGDCGSCHLSASGGGTLVASITGATTSSSCADCHGSSDPQTAHHGSASALNGECINCHMPNVGVQSPLANRSDIMMPPNLACNWCHLWWPNNIDYIDQTTDNGYATDANGKVKIFRLDWSPKGNYGQLAGISETGMASHYISENTTTPISDYGACFACHGATGTDNGRADDPGNADMIRPFHGMGGTSELVPGTDVWTRGNGANSDYTKHVNNYFAGPAQTTSNGTVKTDPYHPGYAAFNWMGGDWDTKNAMPAIISTGQLGGTKPYATDNSSFKFIHDSEEPIRNRDCRNTAIGSTSSAVEFNNWGADLGSAGSITVYGPEATGGVSVTTEVPLVNLSLPTSIGPQAGCP